MLGDFCRANKGQSRKKKILKIYILHNNTYTPQLHGIWDPSNYKADKAKTIFISAETSKRNIENSGNSENMK